MKYDVLIFLRASLQAGGGNGTLFKSVEVALQDSFERSMAHIKMSKEKDKKNMDRLRILQKIYEHVKVGCSLLYTP